MTGLLAVDSVIESLIDQVDVISEVKRVTIEEAENLCLAEDIVSTVNVPPADNSAMDGYAVRVDSVTAGEWLRVSQRIPAGYTGDELEPGTAARIFTGAPMPPGADTVVIQENTEAREGEVMLKELPEILSNVRARGQDIVKGNIVAEAGTVLTPAWIGVLASVGVNEIPVRRPLKIAILSTGDELVEPGQETGPGQIYNSNRYTLSALIRSMGMEVVDLGIVGDTPGETDSALIEGAVRSDCILTSGGVSVGEEDHVKAAVERLGKIDLWKLAIKPGKPLAFGEVRGTPFFGLPGNPVSSFVTFLIVARPFLRKLQGFEVWENQFTYAVADFEFTAGGRREYLRVRLKNEEGGLPIIEKFPNQGSGVMSSVAWCDALAEVEIGQSVAPGDRLKIYPLG